MIWKCFQNSSLTDLIKPTSFRLSQTKKETIPYTPSYVYPKLNFSNLLEKEQSFLENLANLESFNFEEDLKIKSKRIRCAKVI